VEMVSSELQELCDNMMNGGYCISSSCYNCPLSVELGIDDIIY